jgi:hypothetical protein
LKGLFAEVVKVLGKRAAGVVEGGEGRTPKRVRGNPKALEAEPVVDPFGPDSSDSDVLVGGSGRKAKKVKGKGKEVERVVEESEEE